MVGQSPKILANEETATKYLVFTRMPGDSTVGDSGLCCVASLVRGTSVERDYFPSLVGTTT